MKEVFDVACNQNYSELLQMEPSELLDYLTAEFSIEIPVSIESVDDLNNAGILLGRCAANYSFLLAQAMLAKLIKRNLKQEKADKTEIDKALSREEILNTFAEISKSTITTEIRVNCLLVHIS